MITDYYTGKQVSILKTYLKLKEIIREEIEKDRKLQLKREKLSFIFRTLLIILILLAIVGCVYLDFYSYTFFVIVEILLAPMIYYILSVNAPRDNTLKEHIQSLMYDIRQRYGRRNNPALSQLEDYYVKNVVR